MKKQLLWILALTSMISAGNVYYAQPLLGEMGRTFQVASTAVSMIPVLTQIGYVLGLFFITPLGDILEKKKLILSLIALATLVLCGAAFSTSFVWMQIIAVAIGASSVLVQIIFPFVAGLSSPKERAKNLGFVVGSALVGILLSRAVSGFIAASMGWRRVYEIAACLHIILFITLYILLPEYKSETRLSYAKLLFSLYEMARDLPALRAISLNGALLYAGLSAFWASLIFHLEGPAFHLGAQAAGMFGVIGALGAATAGLVGGMIDRHGSRRVMTACTTMMGAAFAMMLIAGNHYSGLIAGVIFLDIGAQGATVTNQSQLYHLGSSAAQTRLNTVYKMFYFFGGAAGSLASAIAFHLAGWAGVCTAGILFIGAGALWQNRGTLPLTTKPKIA